MYSGESSVMVPLSVTSSDPYRVGLHAVRPAGGTCTPTRWADTPTYAKHPKRGSETEILQRAGSCRIA